MLAKTNIDTVFKELVAVYDEAGELGEVPSKVGFRIVGIPEAKAQLAKLFNEMIDEAIGEDEATNMVVAGQGSTPRRTDMDALAAKYGVAQPTIWSICARKWWKHV